MHWAAYQKINWENPVTKRWVLAILTGILLFSMFYSFKLRPSLDLENTKQKQVTQVFTKLKQLRQYQTHQSRFEAEALRMKKQLKIVEEALPLEWNMPDLTRHLLSAVQKSNIRSVKQEILPEKKFEHYAELNILMELDGTYTQLLRFVHEARSLPILLNIRELYIENPVMLGRNPRLHTRIKLSVYRRFDSPKS